MKRAGMIGIPPKHGTIKLFRRRRVPLALKQQGLVERRITRRRLRRRGNFGVVQVGAPANRVARTPCLNDNSAPPRWQPSS
jgi:hypothetical protein